MIRDATAHDVRRQDCSQPEYAASLCTYPWETCSGREGICTCSCVPSTRLGIRLFTQSPHSTDGPDEADALILLLGAPARLGLARYTGNGPRSAPAATTETVGERGAVGCRGSTACGVCPIGRSPDMASHGLGPVAPGRALPQEEQTARPECAGDSARYTARGYSRLDGRLVSKSDICAGRGGAGVVEWRRLFEIRSWEEVAALPTARGQRPRLQGGRDGRYYSNDVGGDGIPYKSMFLRNEPN